MKVKSKLILLLIFSMIIVACGDAGATPVIAVQKDKHYKNKTVVQEECSSLVFPYETELGKLYIRLIDWGIDDDGVVDPDNPNRGRLTPNFKIAPFFEHLKRNEFGY